MREKRDAKIAKHGAIDDAMHVGAARDLTRGNVNLEAEAAGVGDRGAVNDAIEPRPESVGHAHRARLAGGIHRVTGERRALQFLAREADGANLGVRRRIVFARHTVGGLHEELAGARLDDECAKRDGARRVQCASGEAIEGAHARLVTESAGCTSRFGACHAEC
jgi:hypothetical protein